MPNHSIADNFESQVGEKLIIPCTSLEFDYNKPREIVGKQDRDFIPLKGEIEFETKQPIPGCSSLKWPIDTTIHIEWKDKIFGKVKKKHGKTTASSKKRRKKKI